ncbi:MAG: hypothetical protein CVV44_04375 [Spirochaetae bacterium HGW-Spirochaetae-1]|jgi:HEAT repeat protein|nr:MAG: hypothetical protein CVV44_04375 [Spirochaetae bacterium HGW-Spirochaetae-1]
MQATPGGITMLGLFTPDIERLKRNKDIKELIKCLKHTRPEIRSRAFAALSPFSQNAEVVEELKQLINDPDSRVRTLALLKFAQIGDENIISGLRTIIVNGTPNEKIELLRILADKKENLANSSEIISRILVQALNDKKMMVQFESMRTIGKMKLTHAIPYIVEKLSDTHFKIRKEAVKALGMIGTDDTVDHIIGTLMDNNNDVRNAALEALKMVESDRAKEALGDAPFMILAKKMSQSSAQRQETIRSIGKNKMTFGLPLLKRALSDEFKSVRIEAITSIGSLRDRSCIEDVGKMLDDKYWDVRMEAVLSLEKLVDASSLPFLERAMKDKNSNVKKQADKSFNTLRYRLEKLGRL